MRIRPRKARELSLILLDGAAADKPVIQVDKDYVAAFWITFQFAAQVIILCQPARSRAIVRTRIAFARKI